MPAIFFIVGFVYYTNVYYTKRATVYYTELYGDCILYYHSGTLGQIAQNYTMKLYVICALFL